MLQPIAVPKLSVCLGLQSQRYQATCPSSLGVLNSNLTRVGLCSSDQYGAGYFIAIQS